MIEKKHLDTKIASLRVPKISGHARIWTYISIVVWLAMPVVLGFLPLQNCMGVSLKAADLLPSHHPARYFGNIMRYWVPLCSISWPQPFPILSTFPWRGEWLQARFRSFEESEKLSLEKLAILNHYIRQYQPLCICTTNIPREWATFV